MPIARLADADLATFIGESADADALWLFLHVPKTAGSSLSAELDALLPPYRNIHLSDEEYRSGAVGRAFWGQLDRAVAALIEDDRSGRFRSASGHLLAEQAERIRAAIPRTRLVTFVRDPVARVVSDYRYQRTPLHPAHAAFSARYPRLADYVGTAERNKMFHHLALDPAEPVDEVIARVGATFAFVGAVELYAMSFNVLMRLAGVDAMPQRRERVAGADDDVGAVDATMRAAIAERNAADAAIFAHFHALLERHHARWLGMVA